MAALYTPEELAEKIAALQALAARMGPGDQVCLTCEYIYQDGTPRRWCYCDDDE